MTSALKYSITIEIMLQKADLCISKWESTTTASGDITDMHSHTNICMEDNPKVKNADLNSIVKGFVVLFCFFFKKASCKKDTDINFLNIFLMSQSLIFNWEHCN